MSFWASYPKTLPFVHTRCAVAASAIVDGAQTWRHLQKSVAACTYVCIRANKWALAGGASGVGLHQVVRGADDVVEHALLPAGRACVRECSAGKRRVREPYAEGAPDLSLWKRFLGPAA